MKDQFVVINSCSKFYERASYVVQDAHKIAADLGLTDKAVTLVLVDHDPITDGDYCGGANFPGKTHSVPLVYITDEKMMPDGAVINMIAHEMRHAFQSEYDVVFPEVKIKDQEEYQKIHDKLPEEVDADKYAQDYSGFDGVSWWNDLCKKEKEAAERKAMGLGQGVPGNVQTG